MAGPPDALTPDRDPSSPSTPLSSGGTSGGASDLAVRIQRLRAERAARARGVAPAPAQAPAPAPAGESDLARRIREERERRRARQAAPPEAPSTRRQDEAILADDLGQRAAKAPGAPAAIHNTLGQDFLMPMAPVPKGRYQGQMAVDIAKMRTELARERTKKMMKRAANEGITRTHEETMLFFREQMGVADKEIRDWQRSYQGRLPSGAEPLLWFDSDVTGTHGGIQEWTEKGGVARRAVAPFLATAIGTEVDVFDPDMPEKITYNEGMGWSLGWVDWAGRLGSASTYLGTAAAVAELKGWDLVDPRNIPDIIEAWGSPEHLERLQRGEDILDVSRDTEMHKIAGRMLELPKQVVRGAARLGLVSLTDEEIERGTQAAGDYGMALAIALLEPDLLMSAGTYAHAKSMLAMPEAKKAIGADKWSKVSRHQQALIEFRKAGAQIEADVDMPPAEAGRLMREAAKKLDETSKGLSASVQAYHGAMVSTQAPFSSVTGSRLHESARRLSFMRARAEAASVRLEKLRTTADDATDALRTTRKEAQKFGVKARRRSVKVEKIQDELLKVGQDLSVSKRAGDLEATKAGMVRQKGLQDALKAAEKAARIADDALGTGRAARKQRLVEAKAALSRAGVEVAHEANLVTQLVKGDLENHKAGLKVWGQDLPGDSTDGGLKLKAAATELELALARATEDFTKGASEALDIANANYQTAAREAAGTMGREANTHLDSLIAVATRQSDATELAYAKALKKAKKHNKKLDKLAKRHKKTIGAAQRLAASTWKGRSVVSGVNKATDDLIEGFGKIMVQADADGRLASLARDSLSYTKSVAHIESPVLMQYLHRYIAHPVGELLNPGKFKYNTSNEAVQSLAITMKGASGLAAQDLMGLGASGDLAGDTYKYLTTTEAILTTNVAQPTMFNTLDAIPIWDQSKPLFRAMATKNEDFAPLMGLARMWLPSWHDAADIEPKLRKAASNLLLYGEFDPKLKGASKAQLKAMRSAARGLELSDFVEGMRAATVRAVNETPSFAKTAKGAPDDPTRVAGIAAQAVVHAAVLNRAMVQATKMANQGPPNPAMMAAMEAITEGMPRLAGEQFLNAMEALDKLGIPSHVRTLLKKDMEAKAASVAFLSDPASEQLFILPRTFIKNNLDSYVKATEAFTALSSEPTAQLAKSTALTMSKWFNRSILTGVILPSPRHFLNNPAGDFFQMWVTPGAGLGSAARASVEAASMAPLDFAAHFPGLGKHLARARVKMADKFGVSVDRILPPVMSGIANPFVYRVFDTGIGDADEVLTMAGGGSMTMREFRRALVDERVLSTMVSRAELREMYRRGGHYIPRPEAPKGQEKVADVLGGENLDKLAKLAHDSKGRLDPKDIEVLLGPEVMKGLLKEIGGPAKALPDALSWVISTSKKSVGAKAKDAMKFLIFDTTYAWVDLSNTMDARRRAALFGDLVLRKGMSPEEAGKITRDALYDWDSPMSSLEEGLFSKVFMFWHYQRRAMAQGLRIITSPFTRVAEEETIGSALASSSSVLSAARGAMPTHAALFKDQYDSLKTMRTFFREPITDAELAADPSERRVYPWWAKSATNLHFLYNSPRSIHDQAIGERMGESGTRVAYTSPGSGTLESVALISDITRMLLMATVYTAGGEAAQAVEHIGRELADMGGRAWGPMMEGLLDDMFRGETTYAQDKKVIRRAADVEILGLLGQLPYFRSAIEPTIDGKGLLVPPAMAYAYKAFPPLSLTAKHYVTPFLEAHAAYQVQQEDVDLGIKWLMKKWLRSAAKGGGLLREYAYDPYEVFEYDRANVKRAVGRAKSTAKK